MDCDKSKKRLETIASHLQPNFVAFGEGASPLFSSLTSADPKDIVISAGCRTPICKAGRGNFKDTHGIDLLSVVLSEVVKRGGVAPKDIGDINVGNVLPPSGGAGYARMAMFVGGFPQEVPISTVNRQYPNVTYVCSSGLQAIVNIASYVKSGIIDMGIGAGVESMSGDPRQKSNIPDSVMEHPLARDCLLTMGQTSENVAERYGISREKQDLMGFESQNKALKASQSGRFRDEIVSIKTKIKDKEGHWKEIIVSQDDGIRATTLEGLAKLKPAFKENGTTTAGNASQVSDGAAATLVTSRKLAQERGLPILGKLIAFASVGCAPDEMGVGPAVAIPAVLKKAGLTVDDIDLFEINEAFASQATYSIEKLGVPKEKLNVNGGAIALGHPLGCTGARATVTLLYEMKKRKAKLGVVSMCIGTGMGAAAIFMAE